jgi:3-hydroxy-9,10-secoandrosta-1,3,5(10)-triene-9,17-dione monooxygenase
MALARNTNDGPTLDDLIARAGALVPTLEARAAETNSLRKLPDATMADLKAGGFFRVQQPSQCGGDELDFGALVHVSAKLAEGCASTAWIASVVASHHWMVGMFAAEAQDDVWGADPDAVVCSAYAHSDATAVPENGGFRIKGTWHYASGIDHGDWVIVLIPVDDGGDAPRMTTVLVPRTDIEVLDTWHASGLKGTGTNDLRIKDAFVPSHRELGFDDANQGTAPGTAVNSAHIYKLPMMGVGSFTTIGPCFGVAQGALDAYLASMKGRMGVLSAEKLAEHAPLQLKIAEAAAEIDAAKHLIAADLDEINATGRSGGVLDRMQRVRFKRDVAFAAQLCRRAVDRLVMAMGVPGQKDDHPVQMRARDMNALASHGLMSWEPNALPFGRASFGLGSDNPYF